MDFDQGILGSARDIIVVLYRDLVRGDPGVLAWLQGMAEFLSCVNYSSLKFHQPNYPLKLTIVSYISFG